jgi:hypothetical protein
MRRINFVALMFASVVVVIPDLSPIVVAAAEKEQAPPGDVQERAIRQNAPGETGQCVCMRPLGQCVLNVQGCVPHPGNPCNGGCIMQQPSSGLGGAAAAPRVSAPPSTGAPSATPK